MYRYILCSIIYIVSCNISLQIKHNPFGFTDLQYTIFNPRTYDECFDCNKMKYSLPTTVNSKDYFCLTHFYITPFD